LRQKNWTKETLRLREGKGGEPKRSWKDDFRGERPKEQPLQEKQRTSIKGGKLRKKKNNGGGDRE